jgi:hypothetical protein
MQAGRDQNFVPTLLGVSNVDGTTPVTIYADPVTHRLLVDIPSGTGTVTSVSVVSANGFAGTVATATTTPAITLSTTITGILKGNGTAISAGTASDVDSILPTQTGNNGKYLTTNGTISSWGTPTAGAGGSNTQVQYNNAGSLAGITGATSNGTTLTLTAPVLGTPASGTLTNCTGLPSIVVANEAVDTTCFVSFFTAATGELGPKTNAGLTFNSATGALTASSFVGSITGNAATVTFANEAADTTCFIAFSTAATGNLEPKTNTNMTFNASTGVATFASTVLTTTDINGGTIDGTTIGGASAAAITGTTIVGTSLSAGTGGVTTTGTIEVGNASDTTISRSAAGVIAVEGVVIPSISSTNTLTNKRVTPRVNADTSNSATPTLNTDNYDVSVITGQTNNITSMTTNLSGTPTNGQMLRIALTAASGTPTVTWGASFEDSTVTAPTALSTTRVDVGFVWNVATSKWRCIAKA